MVGIGTQPDRLAGRKKTLVSTPVGAWCAENNVDVDKPESVNEPDYLAKLKDLDPDFILVISFGQLLKKEILELPRVSCVNIHASLLPELRGASPIIAALLNQCQKTGIAFMQMDKGLDTGPVYKMFEHVIAPNERCDDLEALAVVPLQRARPTLRAVLAPTVGEAAADTDAAVALAAIAAETKAHAASDQGKTTAAIDRARVVHASDAALPVRPQYPVPSGYFHPVSSPQVGT